GRPVRVAQLAVAVDQGGGARLVLLLDRGFRHPQEPARRFRVDLREPVGRRVGVLVLPRVLPGGVVGADDETGDGVARVADAGNVPPGVGRVRGVDAYRGAVNAADRFAGLGPLAAGVAQDQPVGR